MRENDDEEYYKNHPLYTDPVKMRERDAEIMRRKAREEHGKERN